MVDAPDQRQRRRRRVRFALAIAGMATLGVTVIAPPAPRLVWNVSASAPRGLYLVAPGAPIAPGDFVVARVPDRYRALAAGRRYVPANVPLVKRVAAVPGDRVCAQGAAILVNGAPRAVRRSFDGRGRQMPFWSGCRTLHLQEYLLLMSEAPDSFDGRYFGITRAEDVIGRASLLWAR